MDQRETWSVSRSRSVARVRETNLDVEGLEHDLGSVLSVLGRVERRLGLFGKAQQV
jgi:hypothetical protein